MYQALLIGCGNIGALYDLSTDEVLTHAKAYHLHPGFRFTVFDTDNELKQRISERYQVPSLEMLNDKSLAGYDCISICTPTSTHFDLLNQCMDQGIPLVICEKPVSDSEENLDLLKSKYASGKTRILVNYIRRFQPEYIELKDRVIALMKWERLHHTAIRYQRGFVNNCSHAFDLLQFLTGRELIITEKHINNSVYDHFGQDPTLSLTGKWDNTNLSVVGLSDVKYALFEIDLYFESTRIRILDSGRTIQWATAPQEEKVFKPLEINKEWSSENNLKNYMVPVIEQAYTMLEEHGVSDNFIASIDLNKRMLNYKNN